VANPCCNCSLQAVSVATLALRQKALCEFVRGGVVPSNRWFALAILFIARLVLGLQFQSAGSVAPFLIRDFNISYAQIGMLVGLFMLPGLVVSIPSGFLGRRFGDKSVALSGLLLMAVGGLVSGVSPTPLS